MDIDADANDTSAAIIGKAVAFLATVIIGAVITISGEKSDLSDEARGLIEGDFESIAEEYPDFWEMEGEYLENLLDETHKVVFAETYDKSERMYGTPLDPNEYYRRMYGIMLDRAEADGKELVVIALEEEYRPFQEGWFQWEVTWAPSP